VAGGTRVIGLFWSILQVISIPLAPRYQQFLWLRLHSTQFAVLWIHRRLHSLLSWFQFLWTVWAISRRREHIPLARWWCNFPFWELFLLAMLHNHVLLIRHGEKYDGGIKSFQHPKISNHLYLDVLYSWVGNSDFAVLVSKVAHFHDECRPSSYVHPRHTSQHTLSVHSTQPRFNLNSNSKYLV